MIISIIIDNTDVKKRELDLQVSAREQAPA